MPAEKVERDHVSLLKTIEQKSATVRQKAQLLTERIELFQDWLAKIPGRVEAHCWRGHPDADLGDAGLWEFGLKFHRAGKQWVISYGDYHPQMDHEGRSTDWKLLEDAPLKTKIFAFTMFSDLLASIEKSQDELVNKMNQTVADFDAFAARLRMTSKTVNDQSGGDSRSVSARGAIIGRDSEGRIVRNGVQAGGK